MEWVVSVILALLNIPFTVIARATIKQVQGKLFTKQDRHTAPMDGDQVGPLFKTSIIDIPRSQRGSVTTQTYGNGTRRGSLTVRNVYHGAMYRPHHEGRRSSQPMNHASRNGSQTLHLNNAFPSQPHLSMAQGSQTINAHTQNIHNAVVTASVQRNVNKSVNSLRDVSYEGGKGASTNLYPHGPAVNGTRTNMSASQNGGSSQFVASSVILGGDTATLSNAPSTNGLYTVEAGGSDSTNLVNKRIPVIEGKSKNDLRSAKVSRAELNEFGSSSQLNKSSRSQTHLSGQASSSKVRAAGCQQILPK